MFKDRKKRTLLIASVLITIIYFLSFIYTDITETTRHGITLWNALADGKLRDFYLMNENILVSSRFGNSIAAVYDFPVYLVFAIWNLPLWIFEKITGAYALDTFIGLMWAKGISIPFLVGIYLYLIKIGKKISNQFSDETALLLCLSSTMFLVPILIMGQYDALSLLFVMMGVYGYISEDKKSFLIWFAVAITFKMFALFIFVPLVLLREKKIVRVIAEMLCGCSFLAVCKIIAKLFFLPSQAASDYMSGHLLTFVFQSQIGFVYGSSSIFIMAYVVFCMYCYFKKVPEKEELGRWALYVSFVGFALFFLTSLTHPQWSLLLLPFSTLLICCEKPEHQNVGMWIDTIFSIGLLLAQVIYYSWVFNIKTSLYTLSGILFYNGQKDAGYSIRAFLSELLINTDINYLNFIGGGIFTAGIIFFMYWANPNTKKEQFATLEIPVDSILWVRLAVMLVIGMLLVALMF